jgi:rhodanese-related sulfurtransferase
MPRTLSELLAEARARVTRFEPVEALLAQRRGAVIVDIRDTAARGRDGVVPGSVHVPRTVLEWRLAGDGGWRNPHLEGRELILICDHGYSSLLAAAALCELVARPVGDVAGGFEAWRSAGLAIGPAPPPGEGLPGMGEPV